MSLDERAQASLLLTMDLEMRIMEAVTGVIMFEQAEEIRAAFRSVAIKIEHMCDHPLDFHKVDMEDSSIIFSVGNNGCGR